MRWALMSAAALIVLGGTGAGASVALTGLPLAFARPATAADRLPAAFMAHTAPDSGLPYDSRRVATYVDGKHRHWNLYIFKQRLHGKVNVCDYLVRDAGGGGGCSPSSGFFARGRQVAATEGRLFAGVAAAKVARVEVVGSRGVVHHVPLNADHSFIYDCNAYNGCICVVAKLRAYDRQGTLVTNQTWLGSRCRTH